MRLLIASGSLGKYFHLKEFSDALQKLGVDTKLVIESEYSNGFPSKKISQWFSTKKFKNLIKDFKPDAVFIDRQLHFGADTLKAGIPLFVLLRGQYWSEMEFAKKTRYKGPVSKGVLWARNRIAEKCFEHATAVFPICEWLCDVVKEHHPNQKTHAFLEGIDASKWYQQEGLKLKHPCVGLIQNANWWGKAKEMLILEEILKKLPNVNFYWVGEGFYTKQLLDKLEKYENFTFLGPVEYPDKVREFLTEIDVYALVSGMDLAPLTLKEAQLMEKPVLATRAGGIPEMMDTEKSGYLIEEGDYEGWIQKISLLLEDKELSKRMGQKGREFVLENFSWETIAKKFLKASKLYINEK
jgi:glycosyltransferase involved in cell wall biosynthesis